MRYRIEVDDEARYEAIRDELVNGFERWRDRHKLRVEPSLVEAFCDFKAWYGDGNLVRWTTHDVDELLGDWFPRKITLDDEDVAITVPTLLGFLQYLAFEDLLEGDPITALRRRVERSTSRFREAMRDRSCFGPAKTIFGLMSADGVDVTDQQAVQAWIDAFNARPEQERRALLPPPFGLEVDDLPTDEEIELPAVRLSPAGELAAQAADATALRRLRAFATFAGAGRRLTMAGNIPPSDGMSLVAALGVAIPDWVELERVRSTADLPGVDFTFGWSRAANFVRVARGRVAATKAGRLINRDPLSAWLRALEGLIKMRPTRRRHPERSFYGCPFYADMLDASLYDLLGLLYARGEPVAFDEIVEGMWSDVHYGFVIPDEKVEFARDAFRRDVERIFDDLADLGAVVRTGIDVLVTRWSRGEDGPQRSEERLSGHEAEAWADRSSGYEEDGVFVDRIGGVISLTPLGTWGANHILRARGFRAPVVGEHAEADARTMLSAALELDPEAFEQEVRCWVDAHSDHACEELAEVAADSDPTLRVAVFSALGVAADRAEPVVRRLAEIPSMRSFAMAWLVDQGLENVSAMNDSDASALLAATLASLAQVGGSDAAAEAFTALGPEAEQLRVIDELWRAPASDAGPALEAIAAHHSSRSVAKRARKALFKLRSSTRA